MKKIRLILMLFLADTCVLFSQNTFDILQSNVLFSKDLVQQNTNLSIPLPIKEKNVILSLLSYQKNFSHKDFREYSFGSGLKHYHKKDWNSLSLLLVRSRAMESKDFKNSMQLGGVFLAEKQQTDSLNYSFGFYANQEFFGAFVVPIVGINWKINPKLKLDAKLPLNAQIQYSINQKNSLSFYYRGIIATYDYQNFTQFHFPSDDLYASFSYNELSLLYEIEPIKSLVFQFKVGQLIGSSLRYYDSEDKVPLTLSAFRFSDKRNLLDKTRLDNPFLSLGLAWRLHLED